MINDDFSQILEEIKRQRSHGFGVQEIKNNLSQLGYSAEVIHAALLSEESTAKAKKITPLDAFSLFMSISIIILGILRIGSGTFAIGMMLLVVGFVGLGFKIYGLVVGKTKAF